MENASSVYMNVKRRETEPFQFFSRTSVMEKSSPVPTIRKAI